MSEKGFKVSGETVEQIIGARGRDSIDVKPVEKRIGVLEKISRALLGKEVEGSCITLIQKKDPGIEPHVRTIRHNRKVKQKNRESELTSLNSSKTTAMEALKRQFENPVKIEPRGPSFEKDLFKIFASGKISPAEAKILNWSFVDGPGLLPGQQHKDNPCTGLSKKPLLLVDRITGISVAPGTKGKGIIWTETDVTEGAWYLHDVYMPGGITIESGLCALSLISYLGIDFLSKGERTYRLLGCDLRYYGSPPKIGETLCFQIHVDGHANISGQRMFFFHYDCRVDGELRLSVRNGRAAFMTPLEAENSAGVIWDPETGPHKTSEESTVAPPDVVCTRDKFTRAQVKAFSEGRLHECFGDGFEKSASHVKTPRIPSGIMCLLQEVSRFDPEGGPWQRGYIRVENKISPDDWFLTGHFIKDPCMPGTLMSEACMQALAFYLSAMGFTVNRDGWRFDVVPNEVYKAVGRAQVTQSSKELIYEAFVEELIIVDGLYPTVFADLVATCDGRKSLHIRRLGIRLVPDFPVNHSSCQIPGRKKEKQKLDNDNFKYSHNVFIPKLYRKPSDVIGEIDTIAKELGVPASMVTLSADGKTVFSKKMPLNRFPVALDKGSGKPVVALENAGLNMEDIVEYGRNLIGYEPWLGEDLCRGMCNTFVNRVILDDPDGFSAVRGKNVIYLANHQIQIESMLFPGLAQVLTNNRMVAIANADHRNGWMGPLNELLYSYPEVDYPKNIVYFDQGDRSSMFTILDNFKKMITDEGISVFLHVEGKLGLRCREPVKNLSSVFIDLATNLNLPVIPVRFFGGLPVQKMDSTIDFPYGYCKQDYYLGKPVFPDELVAMPYAERRKYVIHAINNLGPPLEDEVPNPQNLNFQSKVRAWQKKSGTSEVCAVMYSVLKNIENPSESTVKLLNAVNGQGCRGNDPKSRWIKQFKEWITKKE